MHNPLILISGSSGFLGSYICKFLHKSSINYCSIGRSKSDILCDLSVSVPKLRQKFDIIIHAAGKAHVISKNLKDDDDFLIVNVIGTLNLIKGIEESGSLPKYFVYISSVSTYGKEFGLNIPETAELLAKDSYGKSKLEAEKLIINWCKLNNVVFTILRLPLIVGANPPGNLNYMIRGIKKGYYFNISGGRAQKSMVLASDVAEYIIKAATVGGIYNLTDGYHPNFNELSQNIAFQLDRGNVLNMPFFIAKIFAIIGDHIGQKFPINSDRLNKITSTLTFDDLKARKAFGWNPTNVLNGFKINE